MISESHKLKGLASSSAPFVGKRVRVNLHRRGIFRSSVLGTCKLTAFGLGITAETPLTSGRRCLSQFELTDADVAALRPVTSPDADYEIRLELECIEWQERVEKLPLPRARKATGQGYRSYDRRVVPQAVPTGEP
jgi:hypothetical protein